MILNPIVGSETLVFVKIGAPVYEMSETIEHHAEMSDDDPLVRIPMWSPLLKSFRLTILDPFQILRPLKTLQESVYHYCFVDLQVGKQHLFDRLDRIGPIDEYSHQDFQALRNGSPSLPYQYRVHERLHLLRSGS